MCFVACRFELPTDTWHFRGRLSRSVDTFYVFLNVKNQIHVYYFSLRRSSRIDITSNWSLQTAIIFFFSVISFYDPRTNERTSFFLIHKLFSTSFLPFRVMKDLIITRRNSINKSVILENIRSIETRWCIRF